MLFNNRYCIACLFKCLQCTSSWIRGGGCFCSRACTVSTLSKPAHWTIISRHYNRSVITIGMAKIAKFLQQVVRVLHRAKLGAVHWQLLIKLEGSSVRTNSEALRDDSFCISILDSSHLQKNWCLTSLCLFKAVKNVTGSEDQTAVAWAVSVQLLWNINGPLSLWSRCF